MKLDELIEKHRPPAEHEHERAGWGQLRHVHSYGLMAKAVRRQLELDGVNPADAFAGDAVPEVVVSKRAAWEILAEAQRRGLKIDPELRD